MKKRNLLFGLQFMNLKKGLMMLSTGVIAPLFAQFQNGDFTLGNTTSWPHTINGWTNGYTQWVPQNFIPGKDPWVDLTGTGYGNGYYIEQAVFTSSKKKYRISFDLGTFYGWDIYDAGVDITINGKALGDRVWHDSFTYSQNPIVYWKRLASIEFWGTDTLAVIRFTGNSKMVQDFGWGRGVGVIAIDNISLDEVSLSDVSDVPPQIQASIFPNPATDQIQVNWPGEVESIQYEIVNLHGSSIQQGTVFDKRIPLEFIPSGIYYVRISDKSHTALLKLVIQR